MVIELGMYNVDLVIALKSVVHNIMIKQGRCILAFYGIDFLHFDVDFILITKVQ